MVGDFSKVLARAQTDYDFYIECQRDPDGALSGFDLSPEEHAALSDPQMFADALARGGDLGLPTGVKITISGTHDWVNRTAPPPGAPTAMRWPTRSSASSRP